MIKGVHTMLYSSDADALRAFLRDVLKMRFTDVGDGWLIFDVPEAEMGCHPADPAAGAPSGTHNISFYCDDIEKTVAELTARGVEFTDRVADMGYGLVTHFKMPGDFAVQLYQPRYRMKRAAKPLPPDRYVYLWEYRLRPGAEDDFLRHYSPDGTWARLFRRASGYLSTRLLRDRDDPARFVTIDEWESEATFRAFRSEHAADFEALDRACEAFMMLEAELGRFREARDESR